jgi:hypothetical protein
VQKSSNNIVSKILSLPPLVFIGKISYSLYLWHWPVLVFGKYYLIKPPTPIELAGLLFLAFILAILSWKFVETPFRSRDFLPGFQIFGFSANVLVLILLSGIFIDFSAGFPARFDTYTLLENNSPDVDPYKWMDCLSADNPDGPVFKLCSIGDNSQEPDFLFWGDSHARALSIGINKSATMFGKGGEYAYRPGCPPMLGTDVSWDRENYCYEFNNDVLEYIKSHPELRTIILAGRWARYINGSTYKQEDGEFIQLVDMNAPNLKSDNRTIFQSNLENTVTELEKLGRKVVIISPIPEIGYGVPSAVFIAVITGRDAAGIIAPSYQEFAERNKGVFEILQDITTNHKRVELIDITSAFCDQSKCSITRDDKLLYCDTNHLSSFGSSYISNKFDIIFK